MEDGNSAGSIASANNGDEGGGVGISHVSVNSPTSEQDSNSNNEELIKNEGSENMVDNEAVEQLKVFHQDESYSDRTEGQEIRSKNEESGSLSTEGEFFVKPNELNGDLEVPKNIITEELQNEGELKSTQVNDGEYSGCEIVRRSIRNRKSTDNKISVVIKQPKPLKESGTKKTKKPLPVVGTNNEAGKKMTAQVEGSKVSGLGGVRPRKKAQRKRDRKPGCTLRMVGSIRGETAPRPLAMAAPLTCAEYAQCLGLQPAVKFKCHKCGETNFASVGMLREHQVACPGVVGGVSSEEAAACATLATSGSNLHITQKLILCSACDTYFESWDLFLHMQSVHRRHICLFCLAMFSRAERLAVHLGSTHGAAEASHPSADAFRSSRQSPCLLVCCTCERIFSDGDAFFDHSCRSGGFAAAAGDSNGSTTGGGNGEGQGEFPGMGKCSDNSSHSNECSSGTSTSDFSKNTNSNQGATDADLDCTINNAANLCQLHIRVAAKKALKRKDNVLVVIFEKSEPESDQIMMRVESKDSWEINHQGSEVDVDEVVAPVDRNSFEESVSQECNYNNSQTATDSVDKDGGEQLPGKSLVSEKGELDQCILESNVHISDNDSKPKSETGESSVDELDKNELEDKRAKSPENVSDKDTPNATGHLVDTEMLSDEEAQDINIDLTLSDATEDSQIETKERSQLLVESDEKMEDSQHSFKGVLKDTPLTNVEDKVEPCSVDNSKLNGNDYSSESPKSLVNESNEDSTTIPQDGKSEGTNSQAGDDEKDVGDEKPMENDLKENDLDVNQQNGIEMSPEAAQETTTLNEASDDGGGIQLAGEEVAVTLLHLEKNLESFRIQDLLKEAVKVACFSCVYCTHAKRIAVNGKQLAFHLLAEHRFQPDINLAIKKNVVENERLCESEMDQSGNARLSITLEVSDGNNLIKSDAISENPADRVAVSKFVEILKDSLSILEKSCFNCDSYDNTDTSASKVFSKTYECFQCRFATGLHKELYIHNRKMHQKTNLLCIMCKCNFYSYSELLCHLCPGVYVPNERPNFRCCFCPADNLPSAFRFMVHLRKRHHACDVCLEVTGDQQRLSGHVWKHKLNHLCYRCDIAYRNKPDITKHLFWKHGTESVLCKRCLQKKWPHVYHFCVPPAIFTCEECSSTFSRAVALRVHRRLHLGEAPHACPECGQHFISKRLVVRHQELKHGDPNSRAAEDNLSDTENVAVDTKVSPKEGYQSGHNGSSDNSLRESLCTPRLQNQKVDENVSADEDNKAGFNFNNNASPCNEVSDNISTNKESKNLSADSNSKSLIVEKDQKTIKKVVDVMDLPPLNLSSESDDTDDEVSSTQQNAGNGNGPSSETCDDGEKQDPGASSPVPEEELKPVEFVDGIWDNFKTYTANLEEPKNNFGETSSDSTKGAFRSEDIGLMARIIKAEHDYCFSSPEEGKEQTGDQEELKVTENVDQVNSQDQDDGFDHNYCSNTGESRKSDEGDVNPLEVQETSPKKHPKSPKKRKKPGSGSSSSEASDSSDSDSSSCSCGTNCSCSSSSSSSASSSSGSDSDSSVNSGRGTNRASRRDKRKEGKRRRHIGNNSRQEDKPTSGGDGGIHSPSSVQDVGARVDTIIAKEETPPLREVMIRESDLETDESETDEDFYDEQPRRFHNNAAAALALARIVAGNSPSAVNIEDVSLPSPATSVQSPASRPASPTTSRQWQPMPPQATPPPPVPLPLPVPPPPPPVIVPPVTPPTPAPEPQEIRNPLDSISEGCTPLIQPKKRGRKRKRPHVIPKMARRQMDNDKCLSDPVRTPTPKVGKAMRRPKVETVHQPYKLTPSVQVHAIHNSAGALLNSSVIHSTSDPTTPTSVMEGDDGLRLSKRKRVPKRFYGDSSDEENESGSAPATSGSVPAGSGSGKLTIVLNQSSKIPKRKKSSVGQGSSVSYVPEPASRASIDGMSSLHHSVYQSHADVEDQEVDTSSEREENESQNGKSEGDSEDWSGDEGQSEGPSCPVPSASLRTAGQMPGESVGANTGSLYCYCQCPYDEVSEMIACDGKKCAIEWFHFECVGIMVPPKGKWYCPDCRKRCGSSGRTTDHLSGT